MTNEEARNILLTSVHPQTAEEAEAIGIAVKAIPVKPIRYDWASMTPPYVCRDCREDIGHWEPETRTKVCYDLCRCRYCGQAIDWSDTE